VVILIVGVSELLKYFNFNLETDTMRKESHGVTVLIIQIFEII
jgi:hypothetical protein